MTSLATHVLGRYPPFALRFPSRKRFRLRWPGPVNLLVALGFGLAFALAAWRENTLIMPGADVGLLEHPGIWLFLIAQMVIPFVVNRSLSAFRGFRKDGDSPLTSDFQRAHFGGVVRGVTRSLCRSNRRSRTLYQLLMLLGFTAWTWNTYQNQDPLRFLHFDFWDSVRHPWGYWLTRFYKLYVWVLVGPAIVHAQVCLVRGARNLFAAATGSHGIVLDPYHTDGEGGLGALINTVINPMVPIVLASSMLTVAAFWVHQKYDITTMGGLAMTVALLLLIYFVPAVSLRRAILDEKRRQQEHVCKIQRTMYCDLIESKLTPDLLKEQTAALVSLADLSARIGAISQWPQISRIWRLAALAVSSPLVGWGIKQLQPFIPFFSGI